MKKLLTILFFIIAIAIPIVPTHAITQDQIDVSVKVVCIDDNYIYSGSGTLISSKGVIITNKHVVTDVNGQIIQYCFIGESNGVNKDADFSKRYISETKYYSTSSDLDVAILYILNSGSEQFDYINMFDSNLSTLTTNSKVEALGYPAYNDGKLTQTMGKFVSKGEGYFKNYFEATTYINSGNSGGSTFTNDNFNGIPTLKVENSIGVQYYFLSIDSIKNWLINSLGSDYVSDILGYKPTIEKPQINLPPDYNPPYQDRYLILFYGVDNGVDIYMGNRYGDVTQALYEFNQIRFGWEENCSQDTCIKDSESNIVGYYYYFGSNPTANPRVDGKYITSYSLMKPSLTMGNYGHNEVELPEIFKLNEGEKKYFILQAVDGNGNISDNIFNFEYIYEPEKFKDIESFTIKNYNNSLIGILDYPTNQEIAVCQTAGLCKGKVELGYVINTILTNQNVLYLYPNYGYNIDGLVYYISYGDDRWWADKARVGVSTNNKYIKINNIASKGIINVFIKPYSNSLNSFFGKHHSLTINYKSNLSSRVVPSNSTLIGGSWMSSPNWAKLTFFETDETLVNILKGYILLQTESAGEAWYVNPTDGKRYYMKDGATAYQMMRNFSLGITNANLAKIPQEGGKNSYPSLVNSLKGKILLQVEASGEAWYVNPKNGYRYYMKDGAAAYSLMRFYSLGITNNDLSKIPTGNL
ncbi:MAG: serine protease [Atribacterota bacterium]|nr:serine protease [Atribacterota bacterium]